MDRITQHKLFFLIISLLISLPFAVQLPNIKTVDNVDYFTLENDPDIKFYDQVKEIFGNDEFFIIAFKKDSIFTHDNLMLLKEITDELDQVEEIREVKSLGNVNDTIGENDFFIVQKFLETIPAQENDLAKLKTSALSNPLYVNNFISSDGTTTAIAVSVFDKPDDPGYRKRLIGKCEKILDKYKDRTGKVFMAGWTITNFYLSQYMKKDISTFIPVTYIFITLAIFLFFRNGWLTIIAVLNISICMGSTMGLFPLFDITLNNITTIVPPVVMALALCDTVHIFSHLNKDLLVKFGTKEKAVSHILKKVFMPCFLTTLTTAVGFLSLSLSDITPIREFAIIASAGMVFEFIFSFLFLPSLLLSIDSKKIFTKESSIDKTNKKFLGFLSRLSIEQNKIIVLMTLLVIAVSLTFASKIKVETNLLDYFKKNSPVKIATTFIEDNLAGVRTLDVSLFSTKANAFKNPDNLRVIEKIETYVKTIDGVDSVLSFLEFIKDMNESFNNDNKKYYSIPDSENMVAQYLLLYNFEDIDEFVNETFDHAKISIRTSAHLTSEQARIIKQIKGFVKELNNKNLDIRVTGRAVLHVNTIEALVSGQIQSLCMAASVIALILFIVLKSFKLGMLSLVPNL
ncbi:MAG: MMPL family transporter, partial [Proteobacteria bacterium]|nr:MMPL family transporter [Pseudomonadota bacterium]